MAEAPGATQTTRTKLPQAFSIPGFPGQPGKFTASQFFQTSYFSLAELAAVSKQELQCTPPHREPAQKEDMIDFGKSEAVPFPSVLVASLRRTAVTTGVAVWPFGGAACFGGDLVKETSV